MGIKHSPGWINAPAFYPGLILKKMNKDWIYPHEQLPEPLSFVLATIETEHDKWVEIVGFDGKYFQLPGRGKTHNVIAWMNKPEPAENKK